MLELSKTEFSTAIKDVLEAGKELERERIIHALNNDAVIQMNVPAQWLEYLVELIENV
jgi:hypothetical protein